MATYLIRHTPRLSGEVEVSTAKNAVLPILAAGLLTEDPLIIKEVPRITDVETLVSILRDCGAEVNRSGADLSVCALQPQSPRNEERMRKLRASILILGPILARTGSACVGLPGGLYRAGETCYNEKAVYERTFCHEPLCAQSPLSAQRRPARGH